MRETAQLENIALMHDGDRYWLTFDSEAGGVRLSLSNMSAKNPDRIKLEAWAEEQFTRSERTKDVP